MAPVYDFRHVELDNIGRGKRIVKPPGGECSDIFGVGGELDAQLTPRKSKNYMHSTIFSRSESPQNGDSWAPSTPPTPSTPGSAKKPEDTQRRLFGAAEDDSPKRIVDRLKSTIFSEPDSAALTPKSSPQRRNPITGEMAAANGSPRSNGHSNGTANGHSSPETPTNGCIRVRNPPGGRSSGIF